MRKSIPYLTATIFLGIIVAGILKIKSQKDKIENLENTVSELSDRLDDCQEFEDKLNNIESLTSELASSIESLTREIRYTNCSDCFYEISDIESKAKQVQEDFENLDNEIR